MFGITEAPQQECRTVAQHFLACEGLFIASCKLRQ